VILFLLLAGCGSHSGEPPAAAGGEPPEPEGLAQATVVQAVSRPVEEKVELLGVTEPEPNSVAAVSAVVSGRILRLSVREGDPVQAGQIVATLDPGETPAQLAQARAQLEAAANDTRQADTAIEQEKSRVATLRRQAQAALSAAKAEVSRVEAEARALQAVNKAEQGKAQAALETAQRDLIRVKAGARPQEIAAARAVLAELDAQRQSALSQEKRAKRLFEQQVLSQRQLEEAQERARVAEAQYTGATERARLLEEGSSREEIAVAEARVREAEAGLKAVQSGALNEASKQQELESARAQVEQATAALDQAAAAIRAVTLKEQQRARTTMQFRQARAALQQVQARSHLLTVTAPVSGVVTRRAANEGDTAQPGGILLEIGQPGRVRFKVSAPTTRLSSLHSGQTASIRFDSLEGAPLLARVAVVGTGTDGSGSGTAWLTFMGVKAAPLRTGLAGKATIVLRREPAAVVVPAAALIEEEDADAVVVVDASNVAHRRKVKLGVRDGDWIQIREGVRAGERVATVGAFEITDGMKVQPTLNRQGKP